MKLVHAADLHLGYRAYHRSDHRGINIREADVAKAFHELLDRTAELAPDLMLVAGDVFHTVRPSNAAIAYAFRELSRFCVCCPGTRVVVVAGNHDSPKAAETGSILRLFAEIPGVHVAHHEARRLSFPDIGVSILCLPHSALVSGELAIEPEPGAEHNVLLAHAAIDDQRLKLMMDVGAAPLARGAIHPEQWSYVALGHYHIRTRLAANMYYAGAIERTSMNIWAEADNVGGATDGGWQKAVWGKGFIAYDLDSGRAEFHKLESPRPVIDLEPILGGDHSPSELDAAIESALAGVPGGIEGKIVRLRIFNVPRQVFRELDHRKIREYRTRALHLRLEARPPEVVRREGAAAPGRRLTLQEELTSFITHRWRPGSSNVERQALIELGHRYLQEAEDSQAMGDRE